jgi:hypothetical protein
MVMSTVNCTYCGAMLRDEETEDFDNEVCIECLEEEKDDVVRPLNFNVEDKR